MIEHYKTRNQNDLKTGACFYVYLIIDGYQKTFLSFLKATLTSNNQQNYLQTNKVNREHVIHFQH